MRIGTPLAAAIVALGGRAAGAPASTGRGGGRGPARADERTEDRSTGPRVVQQAHAGPTAGRGR